MAQINGHPAPGFGELIPGSYVVPQNPITMAESGVRYVNRMGELLPGAFSVPQNPIIRNFQTGMQGMGTMGCVGLGCDGGGFMGSLAGMGEIDLSTFSPSGWSTQTWWIIGGAAVLLVLMMRPGGGEYKAALSQAKTDYVKAVAGVKRKYRRVGGRIAAGTSAAYRTLKDAV